MIAIHPSRGTPRCRDCANVSDTTYRGECCNHPSTEVAPHNGEPTMRTDAMRGKGAACGPEGVLFELRPAVAGNKCDDGPITIVIRRS